MNIKSALAAFALVLVAATTVVAESVAYKALNEKIESIMRSSRTEMDDLVRSMELDDACKLGHKSGDICQSSKVTCEKYLASFNKVNKDIAEVKRAIDTASGITSEERDFLLVGHGILSGLNFLVKEYIASKECTKI